MRAAQYGRFSSDNQRSESIDAQIRAMNKYCEEHDIMVVKTYADEAISGQSDNREAFLQMIEDAKKGLFDIVLVHKLDRFARNRYDSAIYRKELKDVGVKLISVLENLDDEKPEDVLMLSLLEGMSEYYSKNLAREVRKGQLENALKGIHNGGIPPLGFDVDPKTKMLVVNELEAEAVKMIFSMYADNYGYDLICKALNSKGYLTKAKKPFTKNSIAEILRNEKYIGHYVYNKRLSKKSGNRKYKDEKDIIKIENAFPAIVDLDLWNRKEDILNTRLKPRRNNSRRYYLTNKVYCSCCGGHFVGSSSASGRNKTKYFFYESNNKKRRIKNCRMKNIRAEYLEDYVINAIREQILNDDVLNKVAEDAYNRFKNHTDKDKQVLLNLQQKREKVQAKIDKLLDLLIEGIITKQALESKSKTFQDELDKLIIKINEIEANQLKQPTLEKIKQNLEYMKKNLDSGDPDLKQLVIDTFVYRIEVGVDNVECILIVTPDLTSSYKLSSDKVYGDGAYLTLYAQIERCVLVPKTRKKKRKNNR